MKNQSNSIFDSNQIGQLVGVGFFLCMSLFSLSNILENLSNWFWNFINIANLYLFALSEYFILAIVLLVFYLSLKGIKDVITEKNKSLKSVLIFMIILYVLLYIISIISPMLYDFLLADTYETNSYFEMRSQNYIEFLFIYYSCSLIKLIAIAFVFLKESKNTSFYPKSFSEGSKILDKD